MKESNYINECFRHSQSVQTGLERYLLREFESLELIPLEILIYNF